MNATRFLRFFLLLMICCLSLGGEALGQDLSVGISPTLVQDGQGETLAEGISPAQVQPYRGQSVPSVLDAAIKTEEPTKSFETGKALTTAPLPEGDFGDPGGTLPKEQVPLATRTLKRFGYEFFHGDAAGARPDPLAIVGPDYIVGPGDTLKIDLWGNLEGTYATTVDRNGEIVLPKVGVINLWGQTFTQARKTIHKQIGKYFSGFELNVTMGALRSIQIYLVGEVEAPGTYTVNSLSSVLTALSAAGGPTENGSLRQVRLMRDGETVATIDLYDFFLKGDKSKDLRLQSGDTIFVPMAEIRIGVTGDVRRPAIYELKGRETLVEALALAGGVVPTAYLQQVQVERVESHREKVVIDVDLSQGGGGEVTGKDFLMQDQDLVMVSPIAERGGYVTLEGHVTRPGKVQFQPGMRLDDLIDPERDLLPDYYPQTVRIIRTLPPLYREEVLTANFQQVFAGDEEQNMALREYDRVQVFSREEMEETPEVVVSGAVLKPGSYRLYDEMRVRDLLISAGNVRRRAFLSEAEITRFIPSGGETLTERLYVNLERALSGDSEHNRMLQVDDHLFVRSIPDFGERFTVELQGEVLYPGNYSIVPGETLSSVLKRAGGFTDKAYLRGALFNRESLKATQRQRLEQLIFEQEQAVLEATAEIAQGALSPEEATAAETVLESQRQLLAKLRQAPVTGRMVVSLEPLDAFAGSEGDIELIDGDVLTIPQNPKSVTVLGEVYNPTSLSHRAGRSAGYYLDLVGGANEDADEDGMYIVRADGTVFSKQQAGMGVKWEKGGRRWIVGGFNVTDLYPGDTLLVPKRFKKTDAMREFKDLSTIFYQMALGAAAVASF